MHQSNKNTKFSFLYTYLAISLPVFLTACGGGTETVSNPFLNSEASRSSYSGPAPRDTEVNEFMNTVWVGLKSEIKCGQCHDSDGNASNYDFVNEKDVNVAYDLVQSSNLVDLVDTANSRLVTKVQSDGHGCWNGVNAKDACATSIENMIKKWAGESDGINEKVIALEAPQIKTPGSSKNFPASGDTDPDLIDGSDTSFAQTIYPLVLAHCDTCHFEEGSNQQQQPFFANPIDVDSSYEAAKSKINIDLPANSRFVDRILGVHGCWTGDCNADAAEMLAAIEAFADSINPVQINPLLVTSKSLNLIDDGIIASGGSRHESDAIASYEFKTGSGNKAFDTSGVGDGMDLLLTSGVTWLGAYGLDLAGGRAQATTGTSAKLSELIKQSQQYSIEAWIIPNNVTQEDATIIGFGLDTDNKNFNLSQTLYNYNFSNRTDLSDSKGDAFISSEDAGEILQSSLQHVVATYSNIDGRQIYVNGELLAVNDPVSGSTSIADWDDSDFVFILGGNTNSGQSWEGKIRMVAIHDSVLTADQVLQNFEVGVGQKYFLLFSVSEQLAESHTSCMPDANTHNCFIKFEVSQFDDYSYLFKEPTFINLDGLWTPGTGFTLKNMRIGINGKEAVAGQSFANMQATVDGIGYIPGEGQLLSRKGAVIALEKEATDDVFFLTFELLNNSSFDYVDITATPPVLSNADPVSDIGVRTFDEINETIARMTGIPVTNPAVDLVFQQYRQQLPTIESIDAFLSSHQMAIAQLALTSCSERVEADKLLAVGNAGRMFTNVDFDETANTAFDNSTKRGNAIDPVLNAVLLSNLDTSPDQSELTNLLGADTQQTLTWKSGTESELYDTLITEMTKCPAPPVPLDDYDVTDPNNGHPHFKQAFPCDVNNDINTANRTAEIVKAVCAAAVGSAAMLIQ